MKLLVLCIIAFSVFSVQSCNLRLNDEKSMKYTISEIETLSDLKFPDDSEIIFNSGDEGRGGKDYLELIIFSPAQVKFPSETYQGGAAESLQLIKDSMSQYDFGSIKNQDSIESIWENKNGKWQAKSAETSKGFYLRLENFK